MLRDKLNENVAVLLGLEETKQEKLRIWFVDLIQIWNKLQVIWLI